MNNKFLVSALGISLLLSLGTSTYGQVSLGDYSFDIANNGHNNYTGVGASGRVQFFDDEDGTWSSTVDIINDSTVYSSIVGFYILKPFETAPVDPDVIPSDLVSPASLTSAPSAEWELADGSTTSGNDSFGNVLNEFWGGGDEDGNGKQYEYLYFGAQTQNVNDGLHNFDLTDLSGIETYPSATFIFDMSELSNVDWNAYATVEVPHIFVRWREVDDGGSAKGYDNFRNFEPVVPVIPEPSEVALLALLGMGGLLYARRRFTRK